MANMICMVGIDGSGKTTQALVLLTHLKRRKMRCKYVWLRRPYFLSLPFMVFCRILGLTVIQHASNGKTFSEHRYYKNRVVTMIWPWLQLIDLIFMITLRVYLPLWIGFFLVCDRFIHDLVVDVMSDVHQDDLHKKFVGRLALKLTPKSAIVFLFDVEEPCIAFRRKTDLPNLMYLATRRRLYHLIAADLRIPILRTGKSIDLVQKDLARLLETKGIALDS